MRRIILALAMVGTAGLPAGADMRELSQDELRQSVQNGRSASLSRIMSIVSSRVDGEIVDVRAFESGGIFYRVLIKQSNGRLGSVVLDARSGQFLRANSTIAQDVVKAARSAASSGNRPGKSTTARSRSNAGGNSGNSNAGGNSSNSNAGGNSGNSNTGGNSGNSNAGGNSDDSNAGGNSASSNAGGNSASSNAGGNSDNSNAGGNSAGSNAGGNSGNSNAGGNSASSNAGGNSGNSNAGGNSGNSNAGGNK